MPFKKYLVVVPGIILAFVLYTLSQGFNNIIGIELLGYEKKPNINSNDCYFNWDVFCKYISNEKKLYRRFKFYTKLYS